MLKHKRLGLYRIRLLYTVICALCICALCSCYPIDADNDYFEGLNDLRSNDIEGAKKHFQYSIKDGSPLVVRRSMETLAKIQDVQERLDTCYEILERYNDMDAYVFLARELYSNEEYQKLITLTDDLDIVTCSDELMGMRIFALKVKGDSRYDDTLFKWNNLKEYSKEHYAIFTKLLSEMDEANDSTVLYKFRASVYTRDYGQAVYRLDELKYLINNGTVKLNRYLISDMGKACLYGSPNLDHDFRYFSSIYSREDVESAVRSRAAFYAARIMAKMLNRERASVWFENAMDTAPSKKEYDNALWYYLDMTIGYSLPNAIDITTRFAPYWGDPSYFDDYFDTLSVKLLTEHKWQEYYNVYIGIRDYASNDIVARFAYVTGRLIEEGIITLEDKDGGGSETSMTDRMTWANEAYLYSCRRGYESMYYRIMAAKRLGLSDSDFLYMPCYGTTDITDDNIVEEGVNSPEAIEKLIKGYATHGLDEFIYTEWQRNKDHIGIETAKMASSFLRNSSVKNPNYIPWSLRIISGTVRRLHIVPDEETLKLLYPQNFMAVVSQSCTDYNQKEPLILAIMRTESYFDSGARSGAGAMGLMQLMLPTAQEVARKLGDEDFDIMDPETNVRYGTYYIGNMIQRVGEHQVLAVFAYNGGIGRVRTWVKNTNADMGRLFPGEEVPMDIFLETLPYKETRGYGRLVTAAAAMYATLYYNAPTSSIVDDML